MNPEHERGAGQPAVATHRMTAAEAVRNPGYMAAPIWAVALPAGKGVIASVGYAGLSLSWAEWDALCAAVSAARGTCGC